MVNHFTYQHRCQIDGELIKEWEKISLESFDQRAQTITNLRNHKG
jgi:hypothetical protein